MKYTLAVCAVALSGDLSLKAQIFVLNPDNGHYYEAVSASSFISWSEANLIAQNRGGYLATITSASENAFVFQLINHDQFWSLAAGPWIGAFQVNGSNEPNSGWIWTNNEGSLDNTYSAWGEGEPNNVVQNDPNGEMYVHYNTPPGNERLPLWNDLDSGNWAVKSYVVEYDYQPVPEPSFFAGVAGLGLVAFSLYRRNK
jgi:hypothetical protein